MQLYDNPASPFCRKVRVLALELGIMDDIDVRLASGSPVASENMPIGHNPLGKIPCLIDGKAIYDSRVICRYLDKTAQHYPQERLFDVLVLEALADGVMDAAVSMVYEARCRDEDMQSAAWIEAQWAKIARALDVLEATEFAEDFDMGQIAVVCALGYLDFRMPDRGWRDNHPGLAIWFETQMLRDSLSSTLPHP